MLTEIAYVNETIFQNKIMWEMSRTFYILHFHELLCCVSYQSHVFKGWEYNSVVEQLPSNCPGFDLQHCKKLIK
jgi:hypothetical protein